MRSLYITSPAHDQTREEAAQRAEQLEADRYLWHALGAQGLSTEALAQHAHLEDYTGFVLALVQQYQHRGLSRQALLRAAHAALIRHLNQHADRPGQAERFLAFTLREALLQALHAQEEASP